MYSACSHKCVTSWGSLPCSMRTLRIQNHWATFKTSESQLKSKAGPGLHLCGSLITSQEEQRLSSLTRQAPPQRLPLTFWLSLPLVPSVQCLNSLAGSRPVGWGCGEFHHKPAPACSSFPCSDPLAPDGKRELGILTPAPANHDSINAA